MEVFMFEVFLLALFQFSHCYEPLNLKLPSDYEVPTGNLIKY